MANEVQVVEQRVVSSLRTHTGYVIGIIAGLVFLFVMFITWRSEHDARLLAEVQIKQSEEKVKTLQQEMDTRSTVAAQTVAAIRKRSAAITTPVQAIQAIPDLSTTQLNSRALPDNPNQAGVDVLPLIQELTKCRTDAVDLALCRANLGSQVEITAQKDLEIIALKKKPRFWARVWSGTKKVAIGVGIGIGIAKLAL